MDSKRKSFYLNEQTKSTHNRYLAPKKVKFDIEADKPETESIKAELDFIKQELIKLKASMNQPMIPLEDYLKLESENTKLKQLLFNNGVYVLL
jgi:hypothetical protein